MVKLVFILLFSLWKMGGSMVSALAFNQKVHSLNPGGCVSCDCGIATLQISANRGSDLKFVLESSLKSL